VQLQEDTSEGLLGYLAYIVRVSERVGASLYSIVDAEHIDDELQKRILLCQVLENVVDETVFWQHAPLLV